MIDVVFAVGQVLSIFALLIGAYLSIAEAMYAAKSSNEDKQ